MSRAAAPLPDADPANWVDRRAPAGLRPWLKLGRFDRPTGIWLLMLPGWQGIALAAAIGGRLPDPALLALFALGAAVMRAAGCAYNDILDKDLDARVARTASRPLASGDIGVGGAWAFVAACGLAGLGILLTLNLMSLFLGVASLALIAAYPLMKRITWWPQAWLGLTFNWGALLGFAAAQGGMSAARTLTLAAPAWVRGVDLKLFAPALPLAPILLYASGVLWTLGYDTVYAVQDLEDDALVGVKSSARRLGKAAPTAVLIFYLSSAFLALAVWRPSGLGPLFPLFAVIYGAHLVVQAARLDVAAPASALRLFKSNTVSGLLLFVGCAAGAVR
ncbi:MAG TPA: UbiA family prenyltransferase [Caulobacteraceae bacterium]|nr:UbiA family prenyltransferase [Caulobacteraceae bacterium]